MPISAYAFTPTKRSRRIVQTKPVHRFDRIPGLRYIPNYLGVRKDSRWWDWHVWHPGEFHGWFSGLAAANPGCAVEVSGISGERSRFGFSFQKARAINSWKNVVLLEGEGEYRLAYLMYDPVNCDLIHEYCSIVLRGTCGALIGPHHTTFFAISTNNKDGYPVYPLREVGRTTIGDMVTRDELDENIILL